MVGQYYDRRPQKWRGYPVVGHFQASRLRRLRWIRTQMFQLQQEIDSIMANFITAMPERKDRMVWIDFDSTAYLVILVRDDPILTLDEDLARELLSQEHLAEITRTQKSLDSELARQLLRDGRIPVEVAEKIFRMTVPDARLEIVPDREPL